MKTEIYTGEEAKEYLNNHKEAILALPKEANPDFKFGGVDPKESFEAELEKDPEQLGIATSMQGSIPKIYSFIMAPHNSFPTITEVVPCVEYLENGNPKVRAELLKAIFKFFEDQTNVLMTMPMFEADEVKRRLVQRMKLPKGWIGAGDLGHNNTNLDQDLLQAGLYGLQRFDSMNIQLDEEKRVIATSVRTHRRLGGNMIGYEDIVHFFPYPINVDLASKLARRFSITPTEENKFDNAGFRFGDEVGVNITPKALIKAISEITKQEPTYSTDFLDFIAIKP